jgi:hypothetical protein
MDLGFTVKAVWTSHTLMRVHMRCRACLTHWSERLCEFASPTAPAVVVACPEYGQTGTVLPSARAGFPEPPSPI